MPGLIVLKYWFLGLLQHTGLYPIVSKGMRLIAQGKDPLEGQKHTCGMGNLFHYHSTGFPELDELMRTPQPLLFIMELVQVKGGGWGVGRNTHEHDTMEGNRRGQSNVSFAVPIISLTIQQGVQQH